MTAIRLAGVAAALCAMTLASHLAWAGFAGPVKTEGGLVQGSVEGDVTVFKGIPFAAPPVGELRWTPPARVSSWSGVKGATGYAPACIQVSRAIPSLGIEKVDVNEDCLYLNVWTPAKSADEKLPVMVWLHGGGFTIGSPTLLSYQGDKLAKRGVIVVTVAYRLGALGFLAHPDLSAESAHHVSGNYGLLDMIAGLRWVRDNIAAFGGDPDRVTIFGESAGGAAVSILAASPLAKGLFQRAICESGGYFKPSSSPPLPGQRQLRLADAEKAGVAFATKLGAKSIQDLRAISADEILKGSAGVQGITGPNVDGWVISGDEYKLYEAGKFNDTPVIVGYNSNEGASFQGPTTPKKYKKSIKAEYGSFAKQILKAYPAKGKDVTQQSAQDLARDMNFGWNSWTWAKLQDKTGKSPIFVYFFAHQLPKGPVPRPIPKGAPHGTEIAYVFQHPAEQNQTWDASDQALSDDVADYWTNFAKTGDPNGAGLPKWPAFDNADPQYMHFNDKPEAGPVPNPDQLKAVDAFIAWQRSQENSAP